MSKTDEKKTEVTAKSITTQLAKAKEKENSKVTAEEKRVYTRFKKQIDKAYDSAEKSYLEIAFALHSIYNEKLYRLDNFKNIYEFAQANYNIKKTSCNNFINICDVFGLPNENGRVTALKEEYKEFTSSKLMVMLAFKDAPVLLEQCKPDMSVRKLKEMVSDYRTALADNEEETSDIIDTTAEEVEADETETMNTPQAVDLGKNDHSVLVAQARSLEELLTMQEVIQESLDDIVVGNKKKEARIEIRIVF